MRYCIIRDLDDIHDATAPMSCGKAMKIAKSGKWSNNWSVEKCLENPDGSAPILKEYLSFKDGKYKEAN